MLLAADCEHEVRPITRGNRLCLVYNLVMLEEAGPTLRPPPSGGTPEAQLLLRLLLEEWSRDPFSPERLIYMLDHK